MEFHHNDVAKQPFQAQLEAVPKEQAPPPAMPYREDLEVSGLPTHMHSKHPTI